MRILLLHKFHYQLGGAERIYFETARLLEEAGHEVAFFSMRHAKNESTPWEKYFVSEVDYDETKKSFSQKFRIATRILWNREATENLTALIREFRPDVAHGFNVFHQLSPAVFHVLKKEGVPTVVTLCDFKVISPNYFLYHFEKKEIWESTSGWRCIWDRAVKHSYVKSLICALELWLHRSLGSYGLVDTFLAPSDFLIKKYHELGFEKEIVRIHHPVNTPETFSETTFSDQPLASREERYLYFGRLSPEKGVDVAIRAFAELPDKRLCIVGYGPAETDLRHLVQELGIKDRVEFVGALYGPELGARMRQVKAIIFPAVWYENQPFAMMDALSSGTPLIASRIGGIPDIIEDKTNGFLFEAGNPRALAQAIRDLSGYPLDQIVHNARMLSREYDGERYAKEILDVYQKLLPAAEATEEKKNS